MTYLLDTNVVSGMRRRSTMPARAAAWLQSMPPAQLFISTMTVFEIEHGIVQLARRDEKRAAILSDWLRQQVLTAFEGRILGFDTEAALQAASLHAGRTRLDRDRLIAATALAHGKVIVTRNGRDFKGTGARVVDPFAG